jgi:hypothetical protein
VATVRKTTFFYHTACEGDGPREEYAPGASRSMFPVNVVPGTAGARRQAARDFCGTNTVKSVVVAGNQRYYVSRTLPFLNPDVPASYCSNLVRGCGLGVARANAQGGVDYDQYRLYVTTQPRDYFLREDAEVLAGKNQVGYPGSPGATQDLHGNDLSPLYDFGAGKGYPDEGNCVRLGWATASRFVTRRINQASRGISFPVTFCQYKTGGFVPFNFPLPEGMATVTYVQHCLPLLVQTDQGPWSGVPWKSIARCLGTTNLQFFDVFPAGTLLFNSLAHEAAPGPLGDMLVDLRLDMIFCPRPKADGITFAGHSGAYKLTPGTPPVIAYDDVTVFGNTSQPILGREDFASLFRPDQF